MLNKNKDRDPVIHRLNTQRNEKLSNNLCNLLQKTMKLKRNDHLRRKNNLGKEQQNNEALHWFKSCTFRSKLSQLKKKEELPLFVFNNLKHQKITKKFDLRDSSEFLRIERVSIFQKEQKTSKKSISSRRSSSMSLEQSQQMQNKIPTKGLRMSGFFYSYAHMNELSGKRLSKELKINKQNLDNNGNLLSKTQHVFYQSLKKYLEIIQERCKDISIQYHSIERYSNCSPTFTIEEGNGANIIEAAFKKRWWWKQQKMRGKSSPDLLWTQLKNEDFYSECSLNMPAIAKSGQYQALLSQSAQKQKIKLHNHLRENRYLTNRIAIFQISSKINQSFIKIPKKYYIKHLRSKEWIKFKKENFQSSKRSKNNLLNYLKENNKFWIIKNAEHQNKTQVLKILKSYDEISDFLNKNLSKKQTFIIEEYITDPFLYKNRKFTAKAYALIVKYKQTVKLYWYNEGFIVISSEEYNKYNNSPYIHFTTQTIQINHERYGEVQPLNKLTFTEFQSYLTTLPNPSNFQESVIPAMKKTASFIIQQAHFKLVQQEKPSFQLIQLNFAIDQAFNPWLISIHSNTCLESTSPSIERIYSNLIEDVFKLTLDLFYPPPEVWPKNKMYLHSKKVIENGFQELFLKGLFLVAQPINSFQYEINIDDEKHYYESNIEQNQVALMHFFPQKMRSNSRKSLNFYQ